MVDVTEISAVVAMAGVLVAVVYYLLDTRNQAITRKTELITSLYSTFGTEEYQRAYITVMRTTYDDYDAFLKKHVLASEEPLPATILKVLYFFDEVGVLLSKRLIDVDLIDQLMGYNIIMIGNKTMTMIEDARKRLNLPRAFANFEYLYKELKKGEQPQ